MNYPNDEGFDEYRGKAFLFGLYLGLSLLLLLVASYNRSPDKDLRIATNIYGIQAAAGAMLGYWRIRKRADKAIAMLALPSLWICIGLAFWAIAQSVWTFASFWPHALPQFSGCVPSNDLPYPGWSDIFFVSSDLFWIIGLWMVYKLLKRSSLIETKPFIKSLVPIGVSLLLTGLPAGIAKLYNSFNWCVVASDYVYILLTVSGIVLALALVLGQNAEIPYPLHQGIRYLFAATVIDGVAILAFTVTKIPGFPFPYSDGNWVDWLFLTAMYCWGISALRCPIRREELEYTFHTYRSVVGVEDIYRANDLARYYSGYSLIDSDTIPWVLDKIPRCWRVVKLGQRVIGSTFLFPVPQDVIDRFMAQAGEQDEKEQQKNEKRMFDEVKQREESGEPLAWDCLYLADASILTKHRRRKLAFKSFTRTIDRIAKEHKITVYCCPNTPERTNLTEKLGEYFEPKGIHVIDRD